MTTGESPDRVVGRPVAPALPVPRRQRPQGERATDRRVDERSVTDRRGSAAAAVLAAPGARGHLVVVMARLPRGSAVGLVRTLHRRHATEVVVLTQDAERQEILTLLAGGVRSVVATSPSSAPQARPLDHQTTAATQRRPVLTERELTVLALVADGRSNKLVGEALDLSALTVKSHLSRIARKLGTGDRAAMVAVALRRGLLT